MTADIGKSRDTNTDETPQLILSVATKGLLGGRDNITYKSVHSHHSFSYKIVKKFPAGKNESLICAQWVSKDPRCLHADSEDSDQIGRMSLC